MEQKTLDEQEKQIERAIEEKVKTDYGFVPDLLLSTFQNVKPSAS